MYRLDENNFPAGANTSTLVAILNDSSIIQKSQKLSTLIITDDTLRPSERFIQVVSKYFCNKGYTFKKSQKSFEKSFDKGNYVIRLDFFTTGPLISTTISWFLFFEKLAKIQASINSEPRSYKQYMFVPQSLDIHTRWEQNFEHTWNLYDEDTLTYTNSSLNKAAEKLIKAYEFYVPNYFNHFQRYESLESDYNQDELKSSLGILLAKYFDKPNVNNLLEIYEKQISNREKDSMGKEHKSLEKLKEYLSQNSFKSLL